MRLIIAVLLGKLISGITKFLKIGGGSAAPGLYALSIDPNLVEKLSARIPKNVVITGTNGKTTTAKMLAHFAKESGLKVIRNHTGSNLERGIASTLISHSHIGSGKLNYDLGIWELDEAAFNKVAPKLKPDIVVFLNAFRDQLDRYGEVDTVVKKWCLTLQRLPQKTQVLINGDDSNTSKLAGCFKGKVRRFGIQDHKILGESSEHQRRERLDFEAENIRVKGLSGSDFTLSLNRKSYVINLPLPGLYHIYDAVAAIASAVCLNLPTQRLTNTLKTYLPAFGRVEKLNLNPTSHRNPTSEVGYIFLIKNPTGATQVFETIAPNIKPNDKLLLALNDNLADGTDVSWIWDAEFEKLLSLSSRAKRGDLPRTGKACLKQDREIASSSTTTHPSFVGEVGTPRNDIIISGIRAYDLALRLKYAGIDPKQITVEPDLKKALKEARQGLKGQLFILPTYTAMLELQSILARAGIKKHYWKEEK